MANSRKQKPQTSGVFTTPDAQKVFGDLYLKGRRTTLRLHLKRELPAFPASTTITGELGDLRKVSCLDCVIGSSGSEYKGNAGRYHYAEILPHFVTIGDRHFAPCEPSIRAVHFTTPDLPSIFTTSERSAISLHQNRPLNPLRRNASQIIKLSLANHRKFSIFLGNMRLSQ